MKTYCCAERPNTHPGVIYGRAVFVKLTAEPTPAALEALAARGLATPPGHPAVVTFPELGIHTVWGALPPRGAASVAQLPFIVRIEPSTDPHGIYPEDR